MGELTARQRIFIDIDLERQRQDDKWGGPSHDDQHDQDDWCRHLDTHLGRALNAYREGDYRKHLVRVAALAVAALESHDRKAKGPRGDR